MKFKVNSAVFASVVMPILEVSQKRGVKDFDGINKVNLKIENTDDITISSYNGNMAIKSNVDMTLVDGLDFVFEEKGEICLDANQLKSALTSFPPGEIVEIELKTDGTAKELYVKSSSDEEQFQTVLCFNDLIDLPTPATVFKKEIAIDKNIFASSVDRIKFAFGFERERGNGEFLYWVLRAKKDSLRFASGTSGIFAILDIEGDSVYKSSGSDFDILFLNAHMPILLGLLSKISDEEISIKVSDENNYQIIVSTKDFDITLLGMNPSIEWIDEEKTLNKNYPFKFVTKIDDWEYASKGIMATFTPEMKKQGQHHKALLEADFSKEILTLKSENQVKSSRKIPIIDSDTPDEDSNTCKSATYSDHILSAITCYGKDGNIQIELPGSTGKKPIFVYFNAGDKVMSNKTLQKVNISNGCTERFVVFFVQTAF